METMTITDAAFFGIVWDLFPAQWLAGASALLSQNDDDL